MKLSLLYLRVNILLINHGHYFFLQLAHVRKYPQWWPFKDISPTWFVILILWPFIVQRLGTVLQRKKWSWFRAKFSTYPRNVHFIRKNDNQWNLCLFYTYSSTLMCLRYTRHCIFLQLFDNVFVQWNFHPFRFSSSPSSLYLYTYTLSYFVRWANLLSKGSYGGRK